MTLLIMVLSSGIGVPARGEVSFEREVAKGHFKLGVKYYGVAHYAKALEEFTKAYEVEPLPELLYNMGRCHEGLGNSASALALYRKTLKASPNEATRAAVQARITALEAAGNRAKAPRREPPAREPPSGGGGWRAIAGWVVLSTGGAALLAGGVMGAMVASKQDEYEDLAAAGGTFGELDPIAAEGRTYQHAQIGLLVGGGGLAATGAGLLLWHYLGRNAERERRQVTLTPAGLGMSLQGVF